MADWEVAAPPAAPVVRARVETPVGTQAPFCFGLTNGVNGDQVGSSVTPLNPMLGPLQNNGGPTQTMALLAGSPAIAAAKATTCESAPINDLDQRGTTKHAPQRGVCDVGAYDTG